MSLILSYWQQKQKQEDLVKDEEERVQHLVGARGLRTMIAERRRNGIELPFEVNMTRGSTLALALTPDALKLLADAEAAANQDEIQDGIRDGQLLEQNKDNSSVAVSSRNQNLDEDEVRVGLSDHSVLLGVWLCYRMFFIDMSAGGSCRMEELPEALRPRQNKWNHLSSST